MVLGWLLPVICDNCKAVISSDCVQQSSLIDKAEKYREIECPTCTHSMKRKDCYGTGDPRNMAFVLHWDGFCLKESEKGGYSTGLCFVFQ